MKKCFLICLVLIFNLGLGVNETKKEWALATTAVLTERNEHRHDILEEININHENRREWKKVLNDWWDISSKKDLLSTLEWLEETGHRKNFNELGKLISHLSDIQYNELIVKGQASQEIKEQCDVIRQYYNNFGKKSILAWDYCRHISLCRWGYLVGYLTEKQAWEKIMPKARKLQETFTSWEELGKNYLVGREFWSLTQTKEDGYTFRSAYKKLLKDPASPWNLLPWNMDLN